VHDQVGPPLVQGAVKVIGPRDEFEVGKDFCEEEPALFVAD
jgi:hypothetical protein